MNKQWTAIEQHRLHCVEGWPDSPYKRTVIAAIYAKLDNLSHALHTEQAQWDYPVRPANKELTPRLRVIGKAA